MPALVCRDTDLAEGLVGWRHSICRCKVSVGHIVLANPPKNLIASAQRRGLSVEYHTLQLGEVELATIQHTHESLKRGDISPRKVSARRGAAETFSAKRGTVRFALRWEWSPTLRAAVVLENRQIANRIRK
jgi:hypothetical protein